MHLRRLVVRNRRQTSGLKSILFNRSKMIMSNHLSSQYFCTHSKDIQNKVLSDIEKGGTFDARKRTPRIISNELREKIREHQSSSEGEYMFSSVRKKDMLKDSINTSTTAFSTSYNGAFSGIKNEEHNLQNAFTTDAQGGIKMSFSSGSSGRHSLSEFGSSREDTFKAITSRKINTRIKNIIKKGKTTTQKEPIIEEMPLDLREEEIDGEIYFFNKNNHRVTREGILIRNQEDIQKIDYSEDGINGAILNLEIPGTTIIRSREEAKKAVEILKRYPKRVHAWDTETINVDVKKESIIGKGTIICASCFIGPDVNFGNGPRLFIDNYADAEDVIMEFKEYLEDPNYFKVWHNYGFDRHIFFNHGIDVQGFGGDTMHMARLADPSSGPGQYSLANLSKAYEDDIVKTKMAKINSMLNDPNLDKESKKNLMFYNENFTRIQKFNMRKLFGYYKMLKNGSVGRVIIFPEILEMHTNPLFIKDWVEYSCFDAEITYFLRETLRIKLTQLKCDAESMRHNYNLYLKYWRPFGEVLTDMERYGFKLDLMYLKNMQVQAENDKKAHEQAFLNWVRENQDDAKEFNPGSTQQMQHLLFAPYFKENVNPTSTNFEEMMEQGNYFPRVRSFRVENLSGEIKEGREKPLKYRDMYISGFGIPPVKYTPSGLPSADADSITRLVGDPHNGKFGHAYDYFANKLGEKAKGKELCFALDHWVKLKSIDKLLQTYIIPLQRSVGTDGRIHCSLNINTETGRLSARKPNLQNQPALDKDVYQIRKAFIAEKGNKLIVADYGQLELRILAHMTNCKQMIEAFKLGGDFHSRTAISMYPEIKDKIENGEVLLEWDYSKGNPPAPLVKDLYAAERKKAKIMNFSIAYGKTAHGFANDFNCTIEEAQDVVDIWYRERPEVKEWQENAQHIASTEGWTKTLLGRFRNLSRFFKGRRTRNQGMRRAINTPIQGGAADVVIAAMVKIAKDPILKELGYTLLLQIHDEVILEGPEETSEEALQRVIQIMENPLDEPLLIKLEVDASIGNNWYEAK
ncbi:unnamed protein product [Moneuplotes crassus]|uniref:DNA-directed DNA polymerase family A palm domain-containing protein n=1 Tax=Euplotes crassus TaxID=5936 RepID=A0AAD1XUR1_EUPCR|nr:unnamed protein product [Moneuplotes crassus]